MENVEAARVMIVMPENRLLVDQQKKSTASVFVRVRGMAQLPPQTVNAIRFLVANSVEGLQANHVTVVDNLGNVLSENSESDSILGLTTTQLSARKSLEQYLGRKAEDMLAMVLGPGQAVVRVAAEIKFDTNTKTEEKYDRTSRRPASPPSTMRTPRAPHPWAADSWACPPTRAPIPTCWPWPVRPLTAPRRRL